MKKALLIFVLSISISSLCAQQTFFKKATQQTLYTPKSIYTLSNSSSNFYDATIINEKLRFETLSFLVVSLEDFYTDHFYLSFNR